DKLKIKKAISVNKYLEEFKEGDSVHIKISTSKNIPHPKFHGRNGLIKGKRGRSYVVEVKDKNAMKTITIKPEHLYK
ncbi:50S ribosomal protein L21e, partial [Candidatus Aenigmatarchaeota archaeon]